MINQHGSEYDLVTMANVDKYKCRSMAYQATLG